MRRSLARASNSSTGTSKLPNKSSEHNELVTKVSENAEKSQIHSIEKLEHNEHINALAKIESKKMQKLTDSILGVASKGFSIFEYLNRYFHIYKNIHGPLPSECLNKIPKNIESYATKLQHAQTN